jgi:hypothetical protein
MRLMCKRLGWLPPVAVASFLTLGVAGCDDDGDGNGNGNGNGVQYASIAFTIDDSANGTYTAGELEWKGSFAYDAATGYVTYDGTWTGPFPTLFDDGPSSAGGHEPTGATASDSIWGVVVKFAPPDADVTFEYGAQNSGGGWIWQGQNGTVTVPAGSTATIVADGLVIPAFGTIDFRLMIDTNALAANWTFTPGTDTLTVKGSYAAWAEMTLVDDGTKGDPAASDGIYTFVLSENVGAGTSFPHSGLLESGGQPEFVFVIAGVEYKGDIGGGTTGALADGVTADTWDAAGSQWEARTITWATNGNTIITVP